MKKEEEVPESKLSNYVGLSDDFSGEESFRFPGGGNLERAVSKNVPPNASAARGRDVLKWLVFMNVWRNILTKFAPVLGGQDDGGRKTYAEKRENLLYIRYNPREKYPYYNWVYGFSGYKVWAKLNYPENGPEIIRAIIVGKMDSITGLTLREDGTVNTSADSLINGATVSEPYYNVPTWEAYGGERTGEWEKVKFIREGFGVRPYDDKTELWVRKITKEDEEKAMENAEAIAEMNNEMRYSSYYDMLEMAINKGEKIIGTPYFPFLPTSPFIYWNMTDEEKKKEAAKK